jgi:hypothetical protein
MSAIPSQSQFRADVRTYQPPGPIAENFLRDRLPVRGIMGPFGSGKTNCCIFDALTCAYQMPKALDGNRYFRGVVVRDTYANLWKTTIKSWWEWFPKNSGRWTGGENRQAEHKLIFEMPDGGKLYFEMQFLAIGEDSVENVLRGLELTWGWVNEADLCAEDVATYLLGRVLQKRFPSAKKMGGKDYFAGVVLDLNPPDVDSWIYRVFEEVRPEDWRLYKQPSGLSAKAENRAGVSLEAYQQVAKSNAHRKWWVRRMVHGLYGHSRDGDPVYMEEYDDEVHCAGEPLKPISSIALRLMFDQGVTGPCMLVGQLLPNGQFRIIREYAPGRLAPSEFGRRCKLILATEFAGFRIEDAVSDPAGEQGGDKEHGLLNWHETIEQRLGLFISVAETNELDPRIDGVSQLLRHNVGAGVPSLLISPECKLLRKGFNSHYRFRKKRIGNTVTTDPKPEKNVYSNPHDALQYGVMNLVGLSGLLKGELTATAANTDYDEEESSSHVLSGGDFDVF